MAELTFDFDQVTTRMLVDFKDKTGTSLMALVDDDGEVDLTSLSEELIAGFIWLSMRMSGQPEATWDDALDVPIANVDFSDGEDDEDPTNASTGS